MVGDQEANALELNLALARLSSAHKQTVEAFPAPFRIRLREAHREEPLQREAHLFGRVQTEGILEGPSIEQGVYLACQESFEFLSGEVSLSGQGRAGRARWDSLAL